MISYIKDFYFKTNFLERSFIILFCFFPISIILGNLIINLTFFLIFLIFCVDTFKNKNFSFINDYTFQLLILFFFSLIVNLCFSKEPLVSLPRILKIIEVITLVIVLKKLIQKYQPEFESIVFGFWSLIFSVLIIDIFFELTFGFNTIGFEPAMPGRVASFFGNELIVGSFFLCFSSIYIVRVSKIFKKYKNFKLFFLIIILIMTSLLLGERSNFIKFFIISIFLMFLIVDLKFKYKIFGALFVLLTFFLFLKFNENIKYRYYSQQIENFIKETKSLEKEDQTNIFISTKNNIMNFVKWTKYGAHYNTAYQVFLDNLYFGAGIKNFRIESYNEKYRNEEYKWTDERFNTHPHQIHFEFLSETGLFGYFCFLFFIITSIYLSIKNYLKHKNLYQLVTILYVCVGLIPFLPSGSFFSTLPSTLFWLNYAIMMSYNNLQKLKIG